LSEGKLVFYIENQSVDEWAVDPANDPDPVVWVRERTPEGPWRRERESLSRFLIEMVVFEAILGSEVAASCADVPPPQLDSVIARLELMPYRPWTWPIDPTRFYASDDVLAYASTRPTGDAEVFVAGQTRAATNDLDGIEGIEWFRQAPARLPRQPLDPRPGGSRLDVDARARTSSSSADLTGAATATQPQFVDRYLGKTAEC
jgi:hypothetical protein